MYTFQLLIYYLRLPLSPPDLKNLHSKAVKKERLSSSGIRPFFFALNNALNA